jgi:hypothetical protein
MAYGVARIVLDSAGEIARIAALAQPLARPRQPPRAGWPASWRPFTPSTA